MRAAGLAGIRRRTASTTHCKDGGDASADLVHRSFPASAPHRLWVADITYLLTWQGDAFSRRVVGARVADHLRM